MIGVGGSTQARQSHRTAVQAMVRNAVEGVASAVAWELVEALTDLGALEEDYGPVTCSQCGHALSDGDAPCPRCGSLPGDEGVREVLDADDEIMRDEDTPVHGEDLEVFAEIPMSGAAEEGLRDALLEFGFLLEEAEEAGWRLAAAAADKPPTDEQACRDMVASTGLPGALKDRLKAADVMDRFMRFFQKGSGGNMQSASSGEGPTFPPELRIFQEKGQWKIEVDDPLRERLVTQRDGKITVGGFVLSQQATIQMLQKRSQRLHKLGQQLLRLRQDFFTAQTIDQAKSVLARQGLEQKKVAQAASIPESTLSRWCNPKTGVWVDTPHGVLPLRDFFGRNAEVLQRMEARKAVIVGNVVEARQALGKEVQSGDVWRWLSEQGSEFEMDDRTRRRYVAEAKTMEAIMEQLSAGHQEAAAIAHALGKQMTDNSAENYLDVPRYLRMIRICQDYRRGG